MIALSLFNGGYMLVLSGPNPMHVYSGLSPIIVNWSYFQVSVDRITVSVYKSWSDPIPILLLHMTYYIVTWTSW